MRLIPVTFTAEELLAIRSRGGKITFTPQTRNRCRCNQAPRLKRLSKSQRDSLRSQVKVLGERTRPRPHITSSPSTSPQHHFLSARIDTFGDARCPHCYTWNFRVREDFLTQCSDCHKLFTPVR